MTHQDWVIKILSSKQSQESKVANPFAEPVSSHEVIRPLKNKTGTAYQLFTYVASVTHHDVIVIDKYILKIRIRKKEIL